MGLKRILEKIAANKQAYKELEKDDRNRKKLEQKKKSADERELEKYLEEERQKRITEAVKEYRQARREESKRTRVLDNNRRVFSVGGTITRNRGILQNNRELFRGGLFFK